jgi:hypothetical protein
LKNYNPLFDEGCSALLDHRKEAKLQWLEEDKFNELATNSMSKNIRDLSRGINE